MLAYVAHHASASRPQSDGTTLYDLWSEKARRGDSEAAVLLDGPPFPDTLGYLHQWFGELSNARGMGFTGPAAITYQDVDAWARLTDQHPAPHEVAALFAIDAAWRGALVPERKQAAPIAASDEPKALQPVKAWPVKKPQSTGEA